MSTKKIPKKKSKAKPATYPPRPTVHPGTTLPDHDVKSVQETFRVTPDEHLQLVELAREAGHTKMARYFRAQVGLTGTGG